ncbi:hypothetical protein Acsp06_59330 [Actinomycetospora sp. NBRC 106375]|nr:hypothetical protein Acsp06_59330 [Actinomycetospora sp. NBRC 106375]
MPYLGFQVTEVRASGLWRPLMAWCSCHVSCHGATGQSDQLKAPIFAEVVEVLTTEESKGSSRAGGQAAIQLRSVGCAAAQLGVGLELAAVGGGAPSAGEDDQAVAKAWNLTYCSEPPGGGPGSKLSSSPSEQTSRPGLVRRRGRVAASTLGGRVVRFPRRATFREWYETGGVAGPERVAAAEEGKGDRVAFSTPGARLGF